jgi:hypothetical protein
VKILYLTKANGADYLADMALHGLRQHFGADVVDAPKMSHMYKGYDLQSLYGHGFTLFGLLDDIAVDRSDLEMKVRKKFFDFVVFGSVQRSNIYLDQVREIVRDSYPEDKIVFLDGEDNPLLLKEFLNRGYWYFKRELHNPRDNALPIQFAIPEEKLQPGKMKDKVLAPLNPWDARTYIYTDEKHYYHDYQTSAFARTSRKAGWDCLRHYEIMACYCMPYFENLEYCPPLIMHKLPKEELLMAKHLLDYKNGDWFKSGQIRWIWEDLMQDVYAKLKKDLTTKALATYILDHVAIHNTVMV